MKTHRIIGFILIATVMVNVSASPDQVKKISQCFENEEAEFCLNNYLASKMVDAGEDRTKDQFIAELLSDPGLLSEFVGCFSEGAEVVYDFSDATILVSGSYACRLNKKGSYEVDQFYIFDSQE